MSKLTPILILALSCPGHAEPARRPALEPVPAPTRAVEAGPDITIDDCRSTPVKSRKTIVANGGGRRPWPVEFYATEISNMKEPDV
jgi:hypothetical protein